MQRMALERRSKKDLVDYYLRVFEVPSTYPGDKDDLRQVGRMGVLRAIETFDSTKSKFNTWAWFWIRSYIRDEITRHKRRQYSEDLCYHNRCDRMVLLRQLVSMIDDDRNKELLTRYLAGQTTSEIARTWNVSRQSVDQRLSKIHSNIREKI